MPRELSTRNSTMANMINSSDAILAPTLFMQKQLVDNGISKSRMRHVPFGVSAEHCTPHIKLPVGKRLKVGFIGSIVKYKGLHVLLQAIDRLGREQSCVEVLIYGDIDQGGTYANDMVSLGTKLESVKFCGTFHHSEIGDKLKNLDVLVVPSIWYENSPLVLSAALLSCTPVLVSRLGGMTEIVREGVDGFSFESGNSKKLSSLISKFVNNRDLVLTLSKNLTTKHRRTDFEYIKDVESVYKQIV
jgi:glycosyltransferase involved in cell wall biosynthesis